MSQPHLTPRSPQACSFREFTLDLTRGALMCGASEIKLRPKSFELLKYLVLRAGRLVTKGELLQALWPNTTVGDDAVPHCLMEVAQSPRGCGTGTGKDCYGPRLHF
jgi:DNA-binding winged helix-turn-helix (wHTH) protein